MTQEDKDLLLKDLCARLPYGVKGIITYDKSNIFTIEGIDNSVLHLSDTEECYVEDFKPYLRLMSSMTEEERKELYGLLLNIERLSFADIIMLGKDTISPAYDWLNAHHFDYHDLIRRGLALEAPKGMYN